MDSTTLETHILIYKMQKKLSSLPKTNLQLRARRSERFDLIFYLKNEFCDPENL